MNINPNKSERNRNIVPEFFQLKDDGFRSRKAFQKLGEKYYLSPFRIRDIVNQRYKWAEKGVTICDRAESLSELNIVSRIIRLPGRPPAMLDKDIAELYGTETRRINEQVKRNQSKFPDDFVFQLTDEEFGNLGSQNAMSSWGGVRHNPYAFTQAGCNMLAMVLRTKTANKRAVQIIRAFTAMEMMMQRGLQLSNGAGLDNSMAIRDVYSSLWVLRQAMINSGESQHFTAFIDSVLGRVRGLIGVHNDVLERSHSCFVVSNFLFAPSSVNPSTLTR